MSSMLLDGYIITLTYYTFPKYHHTVLEYPMQRWDVSPCLRLDTLSRQTRYDCVVRVYR